MANSALRLIKECMSDDEHGGDAVSGADEVAVLHQGELAAQVEEEADLFQPLPVPEMPTRSEFEVHCETRVLYRTWCRHCVEGRGHKRGRNVQKNEDRRVPTISFDYVFVGDKGEVTSQEQAVVEEGSVKLLIVWDFKRKSVFGHVVPKLGHNDKGFADDAIVSDIKWLRYT